MLLPKPTSEIVQNLGYCVLLVLLISSNVIVSNANADADNEEKEISSDNNLTGSGTGSESTNKNGSVNTSASNNSGKGNDIKINSIDTTRSYEFEEKGSSSKDSSDSKNSVKNIWVTPRSVTPDLNVTKVSSTPIPPNVNNGSVPDASPLLPSNTESSSPASTTVSVIRTVDSNPSPDVSTSTSSSKNDSNVATSTPVTTTKVTDAPSPSSNTPVPRTNFPPAVTEGGSGGTNETWSGAETDRSINPNPATAGPPQWAIVLISLMICVSLAFTTLFFTRKYCARVRRAERRQLLASRSQEGYFFGENNDIFFNNNEDRL